MGKKSLHNSPDQAIAVQRAIHQEVEPVTEDEFWYNEACVLWQTKKIFK